MIEEPIQGPLVDVVEKKVVASTSGASAVGLVMILLSLYVFHGNVPDWVTVLVDAVVTGLGAFVTGYFAKHTPRVLPTGPVGPVDPLDQPVPPIN